MIRVLCALCAFALAAGECLAGGYGVPAASFRQRTVIRQQFAAPQFDVGGCYDAAPVFAQPVYAAPVFAAPAYGVYSQPSFFRSPRFGRGRSFFPGRGLGAGFGGGGGGLNLNFGGRQNVGAGIFR